MKRKIAILLSAAMFTGVMPMSAMAATNNSISNTVNVVSGQKVQNDVNLQIRPTSGNFVGNEATFTVELENATFGTVEEHKFVAPEGVTLPTTATDKTLAHYITLLASAQSKPPYIPYDIKISADKTSAEVTVYSFDADTLSANSIKNAFDGITPYINIPLKGITAENDGDVKVTVKDNTLVTEGTYTIGTSYSSGSTTATIDKVETFDAAVDLGKITIKENVAGSFKNTEAERTFTLKLNSGFKYLTGSKLTVETRGLATTSTGEITAERTADDVITVKIPATVKFDSASLSSIIINGIQVEPKDEEKNYGAVKITVAGTSAGVTQETIEVAQRQSASFTMEVIGEVPTIVAGRTDVANADLDEEKFKTVKVKFGENVPEAWGSSRLDFNLPEGVRIVGVDFTKVTDGGSLTSSTDIESRNGTSVAVGESSIAVINEGRTLRFAKNFNNVINKAKATSFEMVLKLSIEAGFEGDVSLSVQGAGISEGDVDSVVVAKAVQPIKLETSTTRVNAGYQDYSAADVTITETAPGMLLSGKEVIVSLDALFNTNDIAITNAEVEVDGKELTVKDFSTNNGKYISFKIDSQSTENPATVKIKNVKVGTSRSIPYGSYNLYVAGDAVINNYNQTKHSGASQSENVDFAYNDDISKYEFAEYIKIGASTGTLNNTVKVTIGEKTILINDKAVDIDVAPYIQASSNSTLVPLRFVAIALGVDGNNTEKPDESSKISFDNNTKTATIYYGDKIIQFQAGSNRMNISGTIVNMENGVTAEIKDGRMFVPFRAVGQALGVSVTWDAETRTAIYNAQ